MKTIITIGSGYSGSSAIYEYLRLTNLFIDVFPNKEFSLVYDPGGIEDIENCITNNFTPSKTKLVYDRFIKNIEFYTSNTGGIKSGKNFEMDNKNFEKILKDYLNSITNLIYEGESNILKFYNSNLHNLYKKILLKFNIRKKGKMVLFCNLDQFEKYTKELFLKIFLSKNQKKKDVILDQAGTIWAPHSSTKYYENPKVIVVFRDPRDIFSEFKGKTASAYPGNDVYKFCLWYENIIGKIKVQEYKNSNILKLNFEDFILKNKNKISEISELINIQINTQSVNFDFNYSKKNIGRYKNNLDFLEINEIENRLKKYLYNF